MRQRPSLFSSPFLHSINTPHVLVPVELCQTKRIMIAPTIHHARVPALSKQISNPILAAFSLGRIRNRCPPMLLQLPLSVYPINIRPLPLDQEPDHRHPLSLVGCVTGGRAFRCPVQRPPANARVVGAEQFKDGYIA